MVQQGHPQPPLPSPAALTKCKSEIPEHSPYQQSESDHQGWAAKSNSNNCACFASLQCFTSASQRSMMSLLILACMMAFTSTSQCSTMSLHRARSLAKWWEWDHGLCVMHFMQWHMELDVRCFNLWPALSCGWRYRTVIFVRACPAFHKSTKIQGLDCLTIMAPHNATSKQAKSASYQRSELQQVTHCQAQKQDKLEKQQKKVLKTAYQNDPNCFKKEPSVLLSDFDKEEDTMFLDHSVQMKLSKPKLLTFSTGKIPIASCTTTPITSAHKLKKGPKAKRVVPPSDRDLDGTLDSTSTTSDGTSDEFGNNSEPEADQTNNCAEDGDTATESLMATWGTK
ncbi:hypothetical protein BDR06DRAFT_976564 [Suillus hirtellus]|nr:hypothetical protein BDR06DRAFT_976564 [Suillus hirtellus]